MWFTVTGFVLAAMCDLAYPSTFEGYRPVYYGYTMYNKICNKDSLYCAKSAIGHRQFNELRCKMLKAARRCSSHWQCSRDCDHEWLVWYKSWTCKVLTDVEKCVTTKCDGEDKVEIKAEARRHYDTFVKQLTGCVPSAPRPFDTNPPELGFPECTEATLQCAKLRFKDIGQYICDMNTAAKETKKDPNWPDFIHTECGCSPMCDGEYYTAAFYDKHVSSPEGRTLKACMGLHGIKWCTRRRNPGDYKYEFCKNTTITARGYMDKLMKVLTECLYPNPGKVDYAKGAAGAILTQPVFISVSAIFVKIVAF